MAQFGSDAFSGTEGTELSTYNSAWTKHPSYPINSEIANGRIRASASEASTYYHSGTPASADYTVSFDVYEASDTNYGGGPIARASTSANTFYHCRWYVPAATDEIQLFKFVAGAVTQLGGNVADNLALNDTQNIKLECIGSAIKVYTRGSGTASISQTDASITSAGKAGFRMGYSGSSAPSDTACLHLDNFSADDVGGSGSTGTVASTNAADTSAASGSTTVIGSLARTNAADTSTASGATAVVGSLAKTNAGDSVAASGSTTVKGSSSATNSSDSCSASGSIGSAVSGTLARTNADDSLAASGTTIVTGSLARTNVSDSLAANGSVGSSVGGSVSRTNANDSIAASGTTAVIGSVARSNTNDSVAASGTTSIKGFLALTHSSDSISASGSSGEIPAELSSLVERTAVFRAIVARDAKFQRTKSVSVKFN